MTTKINLVINAMSTRPGGGLTVLLGVLKGLATQPNLELDATVVCSADGTRVAIESQGIAKVSQPLKNAPGIKRQFWVTLSMAKFVEQFSPDIFLSINQYVPRIDCPQVVYHINLLRFMPVASEGGLKTKLFEHLRNHSAKQALKKCSANVFESAFIQTCADKVHRSSNPNDCVIYIGLPENLTEAPELDTPIKRNQLFSITNGNPHKDNDTLIRSVAELVKLKPDVDWQLKIAGGLFSDLWIPYQQLAKELGVLDRIEWLGFQSQDELGDWLSESLCMVATSRVESFCMVALESMARGCPSIVADCAAMPESVGDSALLVPPGDPVGFARSVNKLHEEPEFRAEIKRRGIAHVKRFRWDTCGREFAELFVKLTKGEGR